MIKTYKISLFAGSSILLCAFAITGKSSFLGALIGYFLGFGNAWMLHKDTLLSTEEDLEVAVKRMRRSFSTRLGIITLIVVLIGRYQPGWLFSLAVGIALGIAISFYSRVKSFAQKRGES